MSFEVGELVVPTNNLFFNGEEVPTIGISGTVTSRQVSYFAQDQTPIYYYQVQLSQEVTIGTPPDEKSASVFWFSESDLSQEGADTGLDVSTYVQNQNLAIQDLSVAINTVNQMLPGVDSAHSVYSSISGIGQVLSNSLNSIQSSGIDYTDNVSAQITGGTISVTAESFSANAKILQEVAENMYGIYTVVLEQLNESKEAQKQLEEQTAKADADDAETMNIYMDTFILSSDRPDILIPVGDTVGTLSMPPADAELADINIADLITDDVTLEQD